MTPLALQQGVSGGYSWPIVDALSQPADLTGGWSAACQIRKFEAPTAPLLATLTATVEGSSVVVRWTAEESMTWTFASGYSDVLLMDPSGEPRLVVWQGSANVDRVVTVT